VGVRTVTNKFALSTRSPCGARSLLADCCASASHEYPAPGPPPPLALAPVLFARANSRDSSPFAFAVSPAARGGGHGGGHGAALPVRGCARLGPGIMPPHACTRVRVCVTPCRPVAVACRPVSAVFRLPARFSPTLPPRPSPAPPPTAPPPPPLHAPGFRDHPQPSCGSVSGSAGAG